jgi:hypothetical protein
MLVEPEDSDLHQNHQQSEQSEYRFQVISADIGDELEINAIHSESNLPQLKWDSTMEVGHISDAKLLTNKPETGMSYTMGKLSYTTVMFQGKEVKALLDIGAFCPCTSSGFLDTCYPEWKNYLLPVSQYSIMS